MVTPQRIYGRLRNNAAMNIILQHWTGDIDALTALSSESISQYAERLGADYVLLRGNVFHPTLSPPCQKIHMLNKEFDKYDMVVMLDADMFTRKGMVENVFTDVDGIGRHTAIQDMLHKKVKRKHPRLASLDHPYWGGSIYRLERSLRQKLRAEIDESELLPYSGNYEDEGIMNRLAIRANIPVTDKTYLPGNHWNCGSFEDGVEQAALIHIRKKMIKRGELVRTPKMEVYVDMVKRGLIEKQGSD